MAREYFWDFIAKNNKNRNNIVEVSRINTPYGNRSSIYTGAGPDGVVQTNRPALLDMSSGRPSIIHEGEVVRSNNMGGKTVIPNRDVRSGMIPLVTNSQQEQVMNMENGANGYRHGGMIKGYAMGGHIPSYQNGGNIPPAQQPNQFGLPQTQFQPLQQQPQQTVAEQSSMTTAQSTGLLPAQPQAQQPQQQQYQQQQSQQPQQGSLLQMPQFGQQQAPQQTAMQQQPVTEKPDKQPLTAQGMQSVMDGTFDKPQTIGDFKKQWDKDLKQLQSIAGGNSELFSRLKNTLMGQIGAQQAAGTAAEQQRELQADLSPETARLLQQQRERTQSIERGSMMNQLAQMESQAAIDATNQALQQGIIRTRFEMDQKKELANNLINQGGLENLDRAEDILTELYGSPIDLTMMKNRKSLGALADIVALGQGIEESIQLAKQQGVMNQYGLTEQEIRDRITPMIMNTNPIVQAQTMYSDLVNQGVITQEQANQAMAVVNWTIMNPQGLEISNSFIVTDQNGNQVGNFKTEEEADDFIANNQDKNYSKQFKKNGWIGLKGSYEEYLGSKVEGDVFEQGGKLFRIVNGEKIPARMTPTQPFSSANNSLYKYYVNSGRKDQANEILDLQVNYLISLEDSEGNIDLPAGVTTDHPAYKAYENRKGGSTSSTNAGNAQTKKSTPTIEPGDIAGDALEIKAGETTGGNTSGDYVDIIA